MDVTPFLERLRARTTGMREIEAAAGLEAAMASNLVAPAAYVIPMSERGTELEHTGAVDQWLSQVFAVLQVVQTQAPAGTSGVVDLVQSRKQVKAALVGFVPDEDTGEPVTFLGGELVDFGGDGRMWWADEFHVKSYYRSNP